MLRPVFRLIGVVLVLGFSLSWLSGQRSFARFDAALAGEDLRFDTNEIPLDLDFQFQNDLNFASNVVFSSDSLRAFIGIAASDKVAVFDARDGELIQLLETCPNPTRLTLTPDGRTLLAPCIFLLQNLPKEDSSTGDQVGGIAMIDVETLQVRVIELQQTVFSFLNNLVVTLDSSRAFIASSGTDQVLRIDLQSGTENGRISFQAGTRPSRITLSHDGSFFGVVLVGSGDLPQAEVPDSVRIVDSQSFEETKNLAFTTPTGVPPISFSGLNPVVFSPDGRFALVADSGVAGLTRALFIDVVNEQLVDVVEEEDQLDVLQLGLGVPTGIYLAPDGAHFLVQKDASVCTIEIETQDFDCTDTFPFLFAAMTDAAFTDELMLVGAPFDDVLLAFDWRTESVINALSLGGEVGRTVAEEVVRVPSAPVSVSISPDGQTIAATYFNANAVELFELTSRLLVPELSAENVDQIQNANPLEPSDPIPLAERFFTGVAINNHGNGTAAVELTAEGDFTDPPLREDIRILRANPNPIPVCDDGLGQTQIQWFASDRFEELELRRDSVNGRVEGTGGITDTVEVEGIEDGTFFFLLDRPTGELVDTLRVDHVEASCQPPAIFLGPNPVTVCPGKLGQTNILWDTSGIVDAVEVRLGSQDGSLVTIGGSIGNVRTGAWVRDGLNFFLLDANSGEVLDTTVARLSEAGCLLSRTSSLKPEEQISFATDFLQPEPGRNFRGWVGLETDLVPLTGTFLSYDGELNRLDAGPLLPRLENLFILPEVRISDGFSTEVEIVNAGPVRVDLQFDLFRSTGEFVAIARRTVLGNSRVTFPALGDPSLVEQDNGLFLNGVVTGLSLIRANPNPVAVCDGGFGQTTISWDVLGISDEVEIRVGSSDGNILATGGPIGSQETGEWVRDGHTFFLLDAPTGIVLDNVVVRGTEVGCSTPVIAVNPNPITVCDSEFGQARIAWDATDVAELVEVRVGSTEGSTLAQGGPEGSAVTGQWVRDGLTFHLINASTGAELDNVTALTTSEGCLLSEFEDGYIRVSGPVVGAFGRVTDARRMAITPAQPMGQPHTRFGLPHFSVFGEFDTVLKLVNPSRRPIGRLLDFEGEDQTEPMQVTISLRDDEGMSMAPPVTVELENGMSLRSRLVDLFNLPGNLPASGWVELTSNQAGLVGVAEIQTTDGEALGSVPLQPFQEGDRVLPYLAHGSGFVTSLAIVNPTQEDLEISLELRRADAEVAATRDALVLEAGSRLVGTLAELFPGIGNLLGGTVVIRSAGAVVSMEWIQSDDSKLLAIIPSQGIQ